MSNHVYILLSCDYRLEVEVNKMNEDEEDDGQQRQALV